MSWLHPLFSLPLMTARLAQLVRFTWVAWWMSVVWLSACASVVEDPVLGAAPDRQVFDTQVYPILVRDCGFSTCHGSQWRFFRVVGPGHERLDPMTRFSEPVTEAELTLSYDRARSMLNPANPNKSMLLVKPLEVSAGGSDHEGTDSFGRNVFRSPDDPDFQVLVRWVLGVSP